MAVTIIPIWKKAPFIRLVIPLIAGILIQWYIDFPPLLYWATVIICLGLVYLFAYIKAFTQFRYYWYPGIFINLLLLSCGGMLTYYGDVRHQPNRISNFQQAKNPVIATLEGPLSEKNKSFKANATIDYVCKSDSFIKVKGHIIVYFEKDSFLQKLHFNSRFVFRKTLQPIKSNGNPGEFDYQRYCAFQGIYYQVYLRKDDYTILPSADPGTLKKFLFSSRERIVNIIRKYIAGKKEAGLAEALLIGYKDDLDKGLVQLYSNTGVVHIIAISGLHVGLIYGIFVFFLSPLANKYRLRWLMAVITISGLWLFGFLAGGSASVLRSVIMFSFIVLGENIGRKNGVYNSLAASAFLLLCYNPFWLWDAGFQLSYIAVLSIVIFFKPVYNCLFIQNKLLDLLWKMTAISVSAQILTTPLSIFLFHQFPNYFLLTNIVAVPLSSLILLGELVLCGLAWLPALAKVIGWIVGQLIIFMNRFVEHINTMPFSTWDQLQLSLSQVILIYVMITAIACWLFWKNPKALIIALTSIVCLSVIRSVAIVNAMHQRQLVVYNVPQHRAIDLIYARHYFFMGDKFMKEHMLVRDQYLKPARNLFRVSKQHQLLQADTTGNSFYFCNKRILIIDKPLAAETDSPSLVTDIAIISDNPDIDIPGVLNKISCKHLVFDSSNPSWKISKWKNDCKNYGISCYSVPENGAFILNLN